MLFIYLTTEDTDDTDILNRQNETFNTPLVHRQSSEVIANYSKKLHLIIAILLVVLVLCVVSLPLLTIAVMQIREVTTSISIDQLSKLHESQNHLMICESSLDVCINDKLNSNDVITKTVEVCPVSHNETNTPSQDLSTWSQFLVNSTNTQFKVTPGIFHVHIAIKNNIMYIESNPFYAFKEGYSIILRVYLNGYGDGKGTHVSIFFYLVKDDKLLQTGQPPMGKFTVELLNQLSDSDHHAVSLTFSTKLPYECVTGNGISASGWGKTHFISHDNLMKSNNYYKNDTLYFRISSYDDTNYQVTPAIIQMLDFTKKKKSKEQWYSKPFFAFNGGYQMCLRVDAAGDGEGEGTHVSVYLYLMKGPHDDEIEQSDQWPLRGTFTIELLNQLIGFFHFEHKVVFNRYTSDANITNRVINGNRATKGLGFHKFIPHGTLLKLLYNNGSSDSLLFRISYQQQYNYNSVVARSLFTVLVNWFFRILKEVFI